MSFPPTESGRAFLHPLIRTAGNEGRLPSWVRADGDRRAHLLRVADLMGGWAREVGQGEEEILRWRAAGLFHDALKDADLAELRGRVAGAGTGVPFSRRVATEWPAEILHGPAVAARLREEGVEDEEFLLAMTYHSVGHPRFTMLGEHLYLADFLDPGRPFLRRDRERLRSRLPSEREQVLPEVIRLRLSRLLEARRFVLPETIEFWNRVVAPDRYLP